MEEYITEDQVIYWYRRTLSSLDCDATDVSMTITKTSDQDLTAQTTVGRPANNDSGNYFMGRPDGWENEPDAVYVVTLLKEAGTLSVSSGDSSESQEVPAGANLFTISAAVGPQKFSVSRGGSTVLEATSLMEIEDVCPCGLYNFNAYVGSIPEGPSDPLLSEGLASLTAGLLVSTCSATPSLGATAAAVEARATGVGHEYRAAMSTAAPAMPRF